MDEQQLGGGNNWQDSHPALQSSHARGDLFFHSRSVVWSSYHPLLFAIPISSSPPLLLCSCLLLFDFYSSNPLICFVTASFYSKRKFSQSATVSWSVQRKSTMDLLTVGIKFEIMQKIDIFKQNF